MLRQSKLVKEMLSSLFKAPSALWQEGKRSKMKAYLTAHPKELMGRAKAYCSYLFA